MFSRLVAIAEITLLVFAGSATRKRTTSDSPARAWAASNSRRLPLIASSGSHDRFSVARQVDDHLGERAHDPRRALGPLEVAGAPEQLVGNT